MTSTPTVWTRNRKAMSSKLEPTTTKPSTTTTTEWNRTASGNPRANTDRKAGLLARLGPGLITGASDDDPSGIATYSQAGSQFGFGLLWTILFSYPLMGGIQEISARIGIVTGRGLAGNLRRHFPRPLLYLVVTVLLAANTINIGADIGAMAASLRMLVGGSYLIYALGFGLLSSGMQVFVPYHRYVPYLKWLCLALFAYVGIAFVVDISWAQVARDTFVPRVEWSRASLMTVVAILGTTISPYLFFWQASEEVEEQEITNWERPLKIAPEQGDVQLGRMEADTWFGMAVSNVVAFFVIVTAAVVFHAHGITDIRTTTEAAEALKPVAGRFAHLLFSAGIIGTGLLALPVLAGSSAYAIGEALGWPTGLEKKPQAASRFYLIIVVSTIAGIGFTFLRINPIKALVWAAVINGVASAPIMIVIMLLANRRSVMGEFTLPRRLQILGWIGTTVMTAGAIALFTVMRG
jgi:NRAMP (natural resistance-associated macrophage protein)-like metal ion transporter